VFSWFYRFTMIKYAFVTMLLAVAVGVGIYGQKNPDILISEKLGSAEVISANKGDRNTTVVKVLLDDGAQALIRLSSDSPAVGQRIAVQIREYEDGRRHVAAAPEY